MSGWPGGGLCLGGGAQARWISHPSPGLRAASPFPASVSPQSYFSPSFQLLLPPHQDKGHCKSLSLRDKKKAKEILDNRQAHAGVLPWSCWARRAVWPSLSLHGLRPEWYEVSLSNSRRTNGSSAFPFTFPQTPILTCPHTFPRKA